MIFCEAVEIKYGHESILQNLSLTLNPAQKLALLGPNGAGKTSLLKVLAGLLRPHSGKVSRDSQELWPNNETSQRCRSLYLNSQGAFLLDHSVLDNLDYYCRCFHVEKTLTKKLEALELVGLLKKSSSTPRLLSTGQKRKLTLACALLVEPHILLADEPTNGLDENGFSLCLMLLTKLIEKNKTAIILATHEKSLAKWCDTSLSIEQFAPTISKSKPKLGMLL